MLHNVNLFFQVVEEILKLVYEIKPELHINYRVDWIQNHSF